MDRRNVESECVLSTYIVMTSFHDSVRIACLRVVYSSGKYYCVHLGIDCSLVSFVHMDQEH